MSIFGKPNIKRMIEKKDIKGLVKLLEKKQYDWSVILALSKSKDPRAVKPLMKWFVTDAVGHMHQFPRKEIETRSTPFHQVIRQIIEDHTGKEILQAAIQETLSYAKGYSSSPDNLNWMLFIAGRDALLPLVEYYRSTNQEGLRIWAARILKGKGWVPEAQKEKLEFLIRANEYEKVVTEFGDKSMVPLISAYKSTESLYRNNLEEVILKNPYPAAVKPLLEELRVPENARFALKCLTNILQKIPNKVSSDDLEAISQLPGIKAARYDNADDGYRVTSTELLDCDDLIEMAFRELKARKHA